jgi:transcriptional regulator with XRE-family HTH domain
MFLQKIGLFTGSFVMFSKTNACSIILSMLRSVLHHHIDELFLGDRMKTLKEIRDKAEVSAYAIAKTFKISSSRIYVYEAGEVPPSVNYLVNLVRLTGADWREVGKLLEAETPMDVRCVSKERKPTRSKEKLKGLALFEKNASKKTK